MRLPHSIAIFYNLPWFCSIKASNKKLQAMHCETLCVISPLIREGKDHVQSISQKAGLTGLHKKFLFISTTAISKTVFQEVDSKVILPTTFIKE